jgi:hypothetical protein
MMLPGFAVRSDSGMVSTPNDSMVDLLMVKMLGLNIGKRKNPATSQAGFSEEFFSGRRLQGG